MAGITLAQAEAQLATWLAASTAVASGQSYEIAGRRLNRANLSEINESIKFWQGMATSLGASTTGRGRSRTIVPAG